MKEIDVFISEIIKEFVKDKDNDNKKFEKFLEYIFKILDRKINKKGKNRDKDKYIKIRNNMLSYIVANRQSIVKKLKVKK